MHRLANYLVDYSLRSLHKSTKEVPEPLTMELLERGQYLHELAATLNEAAAGQGRAVLVGGEAGIGKTSLVERFTEQQVKDSRPSRISRSRQAGCTHPRRSRSVSPPSRSCRVIIELDCPLEQGINLRLLSLISVRLVFGGGV